jgi:uncharacterized protein (TIGR03790 family)
MQITFSRVIKQSKNRCLFFVALLCVLFPVNGFSQDGTNVLVVANTASDGGEQIARAYATARRVPSENIVRVNTALTEEVDRGRYEREIESPIGAVISRHTAQDRILYIVLTKGMPLRIRGGGGQSGTMASVDSELTLLYQKLLGFTASPAGRVANPYFLGDKPLSEARAFSHATLDIFLVSRLDGYTVADVLALIDRGSKPVRDGEILLDQRAYLLGETSGDRWLAAAAKALETVGYGDKTVLNSDASVLSGRRGVLGYYSWGSNDAAIKARRLDLGFVPGALAAMFVSTDARTFKEPPPAWNLGSWSDPHSFYQGSPQSLTGDLIRDGITGVAGHVAEPFLDAAIKPQILFPAYVSGFNLIESFYLAMPYLSWQTIVVGDPLCAPFSRKSGAGEVTIPTTDARTELPAFFSTRRVAVVTHTGVSATAAELVVRGEARLARGDVAGAREALESATAADARLTLVHLALAGIYEAAGDYDQAISRYREVLQLAPLDVRSLNNLAYALAVRKRAPAEALPFAEKAYTASKGFPSVADTLGWVHYLLGHHTEAEKYLTEAAKGAPEMPEIQLHLAELYADAKNVELGAAALRRALALQPDLHDREDVAKLRKELGIP